MTLKFDSEKLRFLLLPWDAVTEVVKVLEHGAKKYAPGNWVTVEPYKERYLNATLRHLLAYEQGEMLDGESQLHHLAHAGCCVLFMLARELRGPK